MTNDRFASAHEMVREYAELELKMADPTIHDDQGKARLLGRRYAQLGPVVAGFHAWKSAEDDLVAARELAEVDADPEDHFWSKRGLTPHGFCGFLFSREY